MATVSYTIYSHYDPPEKKAKKSPPEELHPEDAHDLEEDESGDVEWPVIRRKLAPAPIFVPATASQDINTFFHPGTSSLSSSDRTKGGKAEEIAGWYRSLTAKRNLATTDVEAQVDESGLGSSSKNGDVRSPGVSLTKNSSASLAVGAGAMSMPMSDAGSALPTIPHAEETHSKSSKTPLSSMSWEPSMSARAHEQLPRLRTRTNVVKKDKNNWFIMKALQAQSQSSSSKIVAGSTSGDDSATTGDVPPASTSTLTPTPLPAPLISTLADILARDPPPLPNERKYEPPIWLAIGPSNKGFEMLEKTGWREGEPLGPDFRRPNRAGLGLKRRIADESEHGFGWGEETGSNGKRKEREVKKERIEVKLGEEDIVELKGVDVIDLTVSDDEEDVEDDAEDDNSLDIEDEDEEMEAPQEDNSSTSTTYERKALIVPIGTVLKSDRLGIGLKAKTVGPYKASKKRITHNSAALALHTKAADEARKRRETVGRGRRGFERQYKHEQEKRQRLWSYLND
ncbi:hypothetical protein BDN72DRAFT_636799 [Pluteus cervinus]|uniref:Uncharacterized protein n=1 Tax=Pluteus cervinus TaxID=181527 RepID=A0ACD3B9T3_9AGAR|nr:hypothetical protein BDN72DRAFT_636799 [Pluteus cervinus]